jgi:hypothetical protein
MKTGDDERVDPIEICGLADLDFAIRLMSLMPLYLLLISMRALGTAWHREDFDSFQVVPSA